MLGYYLRHWPGIETLHIGQMYFNYQILGVFKRSELPVAYYKGPLLRIDFCDSFQAITHASPDIYIIEPTLNHIVILKNMDLIQINYPDRL